MHSIRLSVGNSRLPAIIVTIHPMAPNDSIIRCGCDQDSQCQCSVGALNTITIQYIIRLSNSPKSNTIICHPPPPPPPHIVERLVSAANISTANRYPPQPLNLPSTNLKSVSVTLWPPVNHCLPNFVPITLNSNRN
jgi:hypothetical protein